MNKLYKAISFIAIMGWTTLSFAQVISTGHYTYEGHGTVNTHWIETPKSVIVIDVQRDTTHAAEAIEAVKRIGKPVSAILITHGHPDHYAGVEQFQTEWPSLNVYASTETARVIKTDHYGYHQVVKDLTPTEAPDNFIVPNKIFDKNSVITIDGVEIMTHEMGASEATGATVYFLPATGDIYLGDLVLNKQHGFFLEERSAAILDTLNRLRILFPQATTGHPGHGAPGAFLPLISGHEEYTQTARSFVAQSLHAGQSEEVLVKTVEDLLNSTYADFEVPGGQPNMVELSVRGLLNEIKAERKALAQ